MFCHLRKNALGFSEGKKKSLRGRDIFSNTFAGDVYSLRRALSGESHFRHQLIRVRGGYFVSAQGECYFTETTMLNIYIFLGIWMIALFVFVCFLLHSVVCYVGCKSLSLIVSDLARAFLSTVFWLTEVLGLTRCVRVWMDNQTPLAKEALAAAAATTTTTTTAATAVKTVETQVPSMRCVLWELGSLPSALWWLCGAWYLQTRPIIAAAVFQEELILVAGKIKRPLWPLSWWGLGWSCCCSPCVWEWGTNRGSSWGSRKPKTTEELQRGSRRKERRESSHIFLAKQQLDLRNKKKKTQDDFLLLLLCVWAESWFDHVNYQSCACE